MQKRLLALVATVAMVLSMFAGIAFADTPLQVKIELDEDTYYTKEKESDLIRVSGKIVDADGNIVNKNIVISVTGPNDFEEEDIARAGVISFELKGTADVGDYQIDIVSPGYEVDPVTFTVLDGEVVTDDDLTFDWSNEGTFEYTARLPLGVTVDEVKLVTEGTDFSSKDGDSGVSVYGRWIEISIDKANFDVPGALKLQYTTDGTNWVTIATGKINKVDISDRLTLSPASVIYGLGSQTVEATLDTKGLHLVAPTTYEFNLGKLVSATSAGNPTMVGDDAVWNVSYDFKEGNYGTHTAKVVVKIDGQVAYEGTKTFTVEHPGATNVLGIPEKFTVDAGLKFTPKLYYENSAGKLVAAASFKIVISGPGLAATTHELEDGEQFFQKVSQAGIYTLEIEAFDTAGTSVATETVEVKATGATMTIEPGSVEVGEAVTVVITLVNQDEKPINNATIFFGEREYPAAKLNPNNGIYEIELKATDKLLQNAGELDVIAKDPNGKTIVEGTFNVLGKQVYEVSTDLTTDVLAGRKTKVTATVTKGDKVVYPHAFEVFNAKGEKVDTINYTRSGDDCVFNLTLAKAGEYTLVARNSSGNEIGVAEFNVVAPVLELSVDNLTNDVKSAFVARLVDPTNDNAPLKWTVRIAPQYADLLGLEFNGKKLNIGSTMNLGKLEEYELNVLMHADYKAAEKAEKVAGLKFTVTGDVEVNADFVMPIADAKLVSIPEEPVVGQSGTLTLKLVDANEAPLAGYKVFRGDNELGKTDENGEVVYRGRMTDTMTFKANLDAVIDKVTQTVDVTVTPVDDYVAPTVEFEEEVDTPQTTIVISDNVRLTRIRINGKEIDFFATDRYEYVANLVPGVNKFRIEVQDSNFNSEVYNIEIVYNAKSTVLEGDKVQRQGEYLFVQLRQFEELGAQIAWNQATRTATFVVGDTKVEITVGSTTAKVNGEAVTMPVAAFIDAAQGRTYVPVRFVSEALGWNVHWAAGDIVTITLP